MRNGWTGGQYSIYRALFGAYLFVHFLQLLPWGAELFSNQGALKDGAASPLLKLFPNVLILSDSPNFVFGLLAVAIALSVSFTIGWHDRVAAVALWYIWACLHGRMPLITNPGMPYIGWLLLAHACLPSAPYLSLAARGRTDPDGGWRMNDGIWTVAWILMAIGYTYSGLMKLNSPSWLDGSALSRVLENPLARPGWPRNVLLALPAPVLTAMTIAALAAEIGFAPLALIRPLRPWIWLLMLLMHLSLMLIVDFIDLSMGLVILHLFTFNPAWIRSSYRNVLETIFYDGSCGLCHRAVRFAMAEDHAGVAFQFAPLESDAFREAIDEETRKRLPDSIIVKTADGRVLSRSTAVFHVMDRLGGMWRVMGTLCRLIPRPIRDGLYDLVAVMRKSIFKTPKSVCPLMPPHLRNRFHV